MSEHNEQGWEEVKGIQEASNQRSCDGVQEQVSQDEGIEKVELGAIKGNLREKLCLCFVNFAFHRNFVGSANTFPMLKAPVKRNAGYTTIW